MSQFSSFTAHTEEKLNNFVEAVVNLFLFLPHFFSVKHLLKTFFSPWKNLTEKKPGGGLEGAFNRLTFNWTSQLVGASVRSMVLLSYLVTQVLFVLILPIAFTLFLLSLPISAFIALGNTNHKQDEDEKQLKDSFVADHMLEEKNRKAVEDWYNNVVKPKKTKIPWYSRDTLFSIPPLARDWTAGYTPTMDAYCQPEVPNSHDIHLIGRTDELSLMEHTLLKSTHANLLLVGAEGVGRETIIQFFAQNIYYGKTHPLLAYKRVLTIDLQKILSGSTDTVVRLDILKQIFAEAEEAGNIILVIHDLHNYVSSLENHIDCSDILTKYSDSDRVNIIGTSTPANYQKYIYTNTKIHEVFTKIDIVEVSADQSIAILLDLSIHLEQKYHLIIPYESIVESVVKSQQFISALPLPESAIQTLDDTASALSIDKISKSVTPDAIDKFLETKLHVPTRVTDTLKNTLLTLEEELQKKIIDQPLAIKALSSSLKNAFIAGSRLKKPLSSFLFLGPTGVGKTESAKALCGIFFQSEKALIRLDMANYQTSQDIAKLLGDQQNPGLLTQNIRSQPYGVLLLDEIEKANHDLLNIFLSVLDEGYFTDGAGERVDCKNLIIIATSNAASDFIFQQLSTGQAVSSDMLINELIAKNTYTPEFLNRFDGVVVFQPLSNTSVEKIAQNLINTLDKEIFSSHNIHIEVTPQTLSTLIKTHYNPQFGARDLKRIIDSEIREKISTRLLENKIEGLTTITL